MNEELFKIPTVRPPPISKKTNQTGGRKVREIGRDEDSSFGVLLKGDLQNQLKPGDWSQCTVLQIRITWRVSFVGPETQEVLDQRSVRHMWDAIEMPTLSQGEVFKILQELKSTCPYVISMWCPTVGDHTITFQCTIPETMIREEGKKEFIPSFFSSEWVETCSGVELFMIDLCHLLQIHLKKDPGEVERSFGSDGRCIRWTLIHRGRKPGLYVWCLVIM